MDDESNLDNDVEIILESKDPHNWSVDDAQLVCQSFMRACDNERTPPRQFLTTQLWRYWFLKHQEEPLMPEAKYNMALMLNAQAFGEFVPPPNEGEFFGRYRQTHAHFEKTLSPTSLTWGPRASMNNASGPTLESAIVHVYIFRTNKQIQEILIVGQGLPELQQEIFQTVFSCMLQVQAGGLDMINVDTYRIFAPNSNQKLFELPGITTLSSDSSLTSFNDLTVTDALNELVQRLKLLQNQTELVAVHDCDTLVKQEFDSKLRSYAQEVFRDGNVIIVAKDPVKSPEMVDLVTLVPYHQIARRPLPLQVVLHPGILNIPSFDELLQVFTYHTVERICADARVRQATYEEHIKNLRNEQDRWRNTDERRRRELWDEFVLITEVFNVDTGTRVRLAQPIQRPTGEYMERSVPSLITQYETWVERMQKIIHNIREATERPGTPIRRLAASHFLDAALRGREHLILDETIRRYFDRWCVHVAPFLRYQWRATLEAKGINPEVVFTPHTVFHTRFQVDDYKDVIGLIMQPFTLISPPHSVIVFDPKQHAMVAHAPSDYAQAFKSEKGRDSIELWQVLEQAATELGTDQRDFTTKLQLMLAEAPVELLPRIVEYLTLSRNPDTENQWSEDSLIREHVPLIQEIHIAAFPSKIITLINQQAFHSARKLIKDMQVPQNLQVHLLLWQILIECLTYDHSANELIPKLFREESQSLGLFPPEGSDQILQLLHQAKKYDGSFVEQWIDCLKNSQDLRLAIGFLRRNWIRLEQFPSTPQRQALQKAQSSVESLSLAHKLETLAHTIISDGESTATVLTKIGQPLADLLLTETGATPHSDVLALLAILVGEESISY